LRPEARLIIDTF